MNTMELIAIGVLVLATYLAAIHLALVDLSHSLFQRTMAARGRGERARWLLERRHGMRLVASLLRTISRIGVFACVLVGLTGVGEHATLALGDLLLAAGISVLLLWIFSSVLAGSIAHHAGTMLLVRSWPVLAVFAALGRPVERTLAFIDEIVRRLAGANLSPDDEVEAELLRSIEDSQLQGALDAGAAELLGNVVEFRSTDVGEVMTPRTEIVGIEYTDDLAAIRTVFVEAGHSRIPVYRENLDGIVGILYVKDLVPFLGENPEKFSLRPLLRQPIRIPETKPVAELLADFQRSEVHLAVVIDEYGGTAGLVTIEDVLEELVGEIQDEHDSDEDEPPACTMIDATHAEVDGRYHIDDLNEELDLDLPEEEEYDTVAGLMLARLGRLPAPGESFETEKARFTVLETSDTAIRRIGVELFAPVSAAPANGEVESG